MQTDSNLHSHIMINACSNQVLIESDVVKQSLNREINDFIIAASLSGSTTVSGKSLKYDNEKLLN